jgi:predicted nucleotidyltransferase/plasmid maintenance system antidote protein VapI
MQSLGETIRKLREEKGLPLRIVAAHLDIDQAILSKIERGKRKASRELVVKLAKFFKIANNDLLVSWLSDKLVYELADEEVAMKALQVAEKKVEYLISNKMDRQVIFSIIKDELQKFTSIKKAWVFGSFSREEEGPKSDIDITLETDSGFSYFDLAEVQHVLEMNIKRKVDVGFIDSFKPYIMENMRRDLKLIYERQQTG